LKLCYVKHVSLATHLTKNIRLTINDHHKLSEWVHVSNFSILTRIASRPSDFARIEHMSVTPERRRIPCQRLTPCNVSPNMLSTSFQKPLEEHGKNADGLEQRSEKTKPGDLTCLNIYHQTYTHEYTLSWASPRS
jgi:hypothetical protein